MVRNIHCVVLEDSPKNKRENFKKASSERDSECKEGREREREREEQHFNICELKRYVYNVDCVCQTRQRSISWKYVNFFIGNE
jgi:hypothetical protein